jgi:hypothetical protein
MMNVYKNCLIGLTMLCMFVCGCKKHLPIASDTEFPMYDRKIEVSKDSNAYYDGCVKCTLTIEKRGFLVNRIFVRVRFRNETDHPVPIEKRNLFIAIDGTHGKMDNSIFDVSLDGKEVEYRGAVIKRATNSAKYPDDYYTLAPRGECATTVNLSRYFWLWRRGKYSIKYQTWNYVTSIVNIKKTHAFKIESDEVYFEKD